MADGAIKIRSFERQRDRARVEDLERSCEVGPRENSFLFIDTMGDPICRIRNSPQYKMLVAELGNELVGVIRGSIKVVTVSSLMKGQAKVGYVLGLRVSSLHRRRGVGSSLVRKLEDWFNANCVDYAYMATEKNNEASVKLFTEKLGFVKFRTPAILVNPVRYHTIRVSSRIEITKLKIEQAEILYRRFMDSTEFFPQDIDHVLRNKLSLGTWTAYPRGESRVGFERGVCLPKNWAMLSVWNCGNIFKLRVGRAPLSCFMYAKFSMLMDQMFPCLRMPVLPDVFNDFGFYFMYGIHSEGPKSGALVHSLCRFVHNMATKCKDCKVIITEVDAGDSLRLDVPHSKLLSCPEDLWCIKALNKEENKTLFNFTEISPPRALFVDPREV